MINSASKVQNINRVGSFFPARHMFSVAFKFEHYLVLSPNLLNTFLIPPVVKDVYLKMKFRNGQKLTMYM